MFALKPEEVLGKALRTIAANRSGTAELGVFLQRVQAVPVDVEEYETEIELPILGCGLLMLNIRKLHEGPRGGHKILLGDRRHHRAQACK